jgi:dipeptidyl aminopeptidase/acylaminoacyl peptidase
MIDLLAALLLGGAATLSAAAPPPAIPAISGATTSSPAIPAAPAPVPRLLAIDDQFALGTVEDPRLSPDGAWVAYTVQMMDRKKDAATTDLWMVPYAGGEAVRLTAGEKSAKSPRWSPDGRYLAFLSGREGCHTQVWLFNRQGGEARRLTSFKGDVGDLAWSPDSRRLALVVGDPDPAEKTEGAPSSTSGTPSPLAIAADLSWAAAGDGADRKGEAQCEPASPKPIVIRRLQFKRDGEGYLSELRNHLYVFDLAARTASQVTGGPYDDSDPAWSPDGRWLAFTSNRTADPDANENSDIFVVPAAAGFSPRAVTTSAATDEAPAWSPDGRLIAYVEGGDPKDFWYGTSHIAVAPAPGAAPPGSPQGAVAAPRPLTAALDRNVTVPHWSADGRDVLFLIEEGGNSHLARVPASGGAVERLVDGERTVTAFDRGARGELVVLESEPDRPFEVSAVTARGLRRLTATNDAVLRGLRLAKVERRQTRSADGAAIDVFLTLPPDAPPGARLPTILRIHGGPTLQFDTAFRFEWQLLAAHGYAVVAANPRGSAGYGRDFARVLWADWGHRDFEDVMAAVDKAVALGIADPDRLGVGGWSYGGILTDYVITKTERFKAAIAGASETNFLANYGTDHYQYAWETELGLPWRNVDLWVKLSPWFQVEKITTPTLLLCGTDDANVPALNSEQLYQALRRLGRDTELVLYPGQYHGFTRPSFLADRYERYLAWYDKYLKPPPIGAKTSSSKGPETKGPEPSQGAPAGASPATSAPPGR